MNVKCEEDLVLIDSGCTSHIETQEKNLNLKSTSPNKHSIELANGERLQIVQGIGDVKMSIQDENGNAHNVTLRDSLYIPSFKKDIMSVSKLVKSGHSVHFTPEGSNITTNDGAVFHLIPKNNLYYLSRNNTVPDELHHVSSVSSTPHTLREWHTLMGHCNQDDLLRLEDSVKGMKITDKQKFFCTTCPQGKMTNIRNRTPESRATRKLQLVYCDVIGPIEPTSLGGYRYGMSFVDSYTGLIQVYLMKKKSHVIHSLSRYIAEVAPYGKIERLRCDNALEFKSKEFEKILLDNKIKQEFCAPYLPHLNAVAERSHRTIMDMTRCLLIQSGLHKSLWSFALKTAVYTRNRCFNARIRMTPFEDLTGIKPNLIFKHHESVRK